MKKVEKIKLHCAGCDTAFERPPSAVRQGRGVYCSRACNAKANLLRHGATRHGRCGTGEYRSWAAMLQRCRNPEATKYPAYGGVGITVCEQWQTFQGFFADMGARPPGTTLDRIDGEKGYSKDNCRWASPRQQQENIRTNRLVRYEGVEMTRSALARKLGLGPSTLAYRLDHGWPESLWAKSSWRARRV
jgi:hypothetical protein